MPPNADKNTQEIRREWLLNSFKKAPAVNSNNAEPVWQQDNHAIKLWSGKVIEQKADCLHDNPVAAGYVTEAWHWKYLSAIDYSGGKGLIAIQYL